MNTDTLMTRPKGQLDPALAQAFSWGADAAAHGEPKTPPVYMRMGSRMRRAWVAGYDAKGGEVAK